MLLVDRFADVGTSGIAADPGGAIGGGTADAAQPLGGLDIADRPGNRFVPELLWRLLAEPTHRQPPHDDDSIDRPGELRYATDTVRHGAPQLVRLAPIVSNWAFCSSLSVARKSS